MANILVIDDEEIVREKIKMILKDEGYNIFLAENGASGIDILKNNAIDLIILDIIMPKKGGIETLMDLQTSFKNIKIIIITGKVSNESDAFVNLVKNFGASKILNKPFQKQTLIDSVKELLDK